MKDATADRLLNVFVIVVTILALTLGLSLAVFVVELLSTWMW